MRAKLKSMFCSDLDLGTYYPDEPDCFGFVLQAMIGREDTDGQELFQIEVCTPKWLIAQSSPDDVIFGINKLIVFDYNLKNIEAAISRYCERSVGDNWTDIAVRLQRIGHWEFENYRTDAAKK